MTKEQFHIIKKMETIHKVRIYGEGSRKSLIVFSFNENKNRYLSYRIGYKGTADLLSVIKGNKKVEETFFKMRTRKEWHNGTES
jgi:hypothetical protein